MLTKTFSYQGLRLQNCIVRSATNDYCGCKDGSISEKQVSIYRRLAESGIGLIITGNFFVMEEGRLDETQNAIDDTFDYKGAKQLCDTVHEFQGAIVFQISHAGQKTKVYSQNRERYQDVSKLTEKEITKIVISFAEAARRVKESGADGVQIHFGHGYLLCQLLNDRADGIEIARKLLSTVREYVGDYPILVKANTDISPMRKCGFYKCCEELSVWAVELSGSNFVDKTKEEHLYYVREIRTCKEVCEVPIILTGGIRNARDIGYALELGADMVGMSRPFICQPDWMKYIQTENSKCLSCNHCFKSYKENQRHCILRKEP